MPLPSTRSPVYAERFPSFAVIGSVVHHSIGGAKKELRPGESVSYARHGLFEVKETRENYGRILVTLPSGKTHEAVIPACTRLVIANGARQLEPRIPKSELGYVCPDWAKTCWEPRECTLEPATDGSYVLIDHSLNGVTIYVGVTAREVRQWLAGYQ